MRWRSRTENEALEEERVCMENEMEIRDESNLGRKRSTTDGNSSAPRRPTNINPGKFSRIGCLLYQCSNLT